MSSGTSKDKNNPTARQTQHISPGPQSGISTAPDGKQMPCAGLRRYPTRLPGRTFNPRAGLHFQKMMLLKNLFSNSESSFPSFSPACLDSPTEKDLPANREVRHAYMPVPTWLPILKNKKSRSCNTAPNTAYGTNCAVQYGLFAGVVLLLVKLCLGLQSLFALCSAFGGIFKLAATFTICIHMTIQFTDEFILRQQRHHSYVIDIPHKRHI